MKLAAIISDINPVVIIGGIKLVVINDELKLVVINGKIKTKLHTQLKVPNGQWCTFYV